MVKEDCSQFKEPKGDPNDKTINWSYYKYEPKPELTPDEMDKAIIWNSAANYRATMYDFTEYELKKIKDRYGEWEGLNDEEMVKWGDKLKDGLLSGEFVLD